MIAMPKVCVQTIANHEWRHLWPFCRWILAPTTCKAILSIFDFQNADAHQGGLHLKKIKYITEIDGPPFCHYARITQNSYWAQLRKQWICQTCPR